MSLRAAKMYAGIAAITGLRISKIEQISRRLGEIGLLSRIPGRYAPAKSEMEAAYLLIGVLAAADGYHQSILGLLRNGREIAELRCPEWPASTFAADLAGMLVEIGQSGRTDHGGIGLVRGGTAICGWIENGERDGRLLHWWYGSRAIVYGCGVKREARISREAIRKVALLFSGCDQNAAA